MPGPQVKDWKMYEALRKRRGMSKEMAAKIANARAKGKPRPLHKAKK
jgi:hypothetical protein